jgi:outer membrane protein
VRTEVTLKKTIQTFAATGLLLAGATFAKAGEGGLFGWIHGDWYLKVGATGMVAPDFEGGKDYLFSASPIISLGKIGPEARYTSRNDAISFSLYDTGAVRAGVAGKLIFGRDGNDADELKGLDPVRFGGELGAFAELYPTDWLRVRGEVRHGIRSHNGIVADVSADAFYDVTDTVRISAGPRVSFASSDYFDAYYGVNADEAAASGLSEYDPSGGIKSAGIGGAIDWKVTDRMTANVFGEYVRLLGSAEDSSLVRERGSKDQFMVGVSATYRFDFKL